MTIFIEKLLLPEDDGLHILKAKSHTLYKLKAIAVYMQAFNTALKNGNWFDRYYIDLQAGPGKNRIGQQVYLGSPLLALTTDTPFTQYRFNEQDPSSHTALQLRVAASPHNKVTRTYRSDANAIVKTICEEISKQDALAKLRKKWSTVNLAFLDPFGLELEWSTVEQLARMTRMDLVINFSTGGLNRNIAKALNARQENVVDRFFGTEAWRDVYDPSVDATAKRRAWIDFYLQRLERFGYQIDINPDLGGTELSVKSAKNVQIYSLIFASKHPLGNTLWKAAAKGSTPRLPGL